MIPKQNRGTTFSWIDPDDDLVDADERTPLDPPLAGLDDEQLVAAVVRLYEPWNDDRGPSYRDLASYVPYTREWVGSRVRAWRDGDYRDLVPDPRTAADETAGDATAAEAARATDGGRDR